MTAWTIALLGSALAAQGVQKIPAAGAPAQTAQAPGQAEGLGRAAEEYVASRLDLEDGTFHVWDDQEDGAWELAFERVLPETLRRLGRGRWSLCVEFIQRGVEEDEPDVVLDVDFIGVKTERGWSFEEVLIHKVDGRLRFTYDEKNERVPVRHSDEENQYEEITL